MDTLVCPKGHQSSDLDYCSECGAKIGGGNGSGSAVASTGICPDCATPREHKGVVFCEICGYNFTTGARGEVPRNDSVVPVVEVPTIVTLPEEEPQPADSAEITAATAWAVIVSVDESSKVPDSPDAPADIASFEVALDKPVNLIGRTSQTRAIFPEIAIDYDDAVSHRHALLQFDANGALLLRDIGAANGTQVNGSEITPMVDYALQDGDEITLGHWSKISVTGSRAKAIA